MWQEARTQADKDKGQEYLFGYWGISKWIQPTDNFGFRILDVGFEVVRGEKDLRLLISANICSSMGFSPSENPKSAIRTHFN